MRKPKPKTLLLLAGAVVLTLIPIELLLQILGGVFPASPPVAGPGDKILVIGDSHARSLPGAPEFSFPDQLASLLARRPRPSPVILNGAAPDFNTSELLSRIDASLREHEPKLLVVLAGDANFWNLHHVHLYLDGGPTFAGFFSQLRLARLFGAGPQAFPVVPPRKGKRGLIRREPSLFFRDVALGEFFTLGARWAGYLLAHRGRLDLTPDEAAEAEEVLQSSLLDPEGRRAPAVARALTDLLRWLHRDAEAAAIEAKYRHALTSREAADFQRRARLLAESGKPGESLAVLEAGLAQNPFSAGGEPPSYENFRFVTAQEFASALAAAMPEGALGNGKPGIGSIRESFLDEAELAGWLRHDLATLVRFARSRGVGVVLMTYPPERFTGHERAADAVIRRVGEELRVPLVDVSAELRRRWDGRALDAYYGTPGLPERDDHLNRDGNALVAEILAGELSRLGLLP